MRFTVFLFTAVAGAVTDLVTPSPTIKISSNVELPFVTLGTGSGQHGNVANATMLWLGSTSGVSIDTSIIYNDEGQVAQGIAHVGKDRSSVFLETKITCGDYEAARKMIEYNLRQLNTTYVDLHLIHFPSKSKAEVAATWRALEDSLAANETRAIGVSNFGIDDLEALMENARITPSVNQCELSVSYHDDKTIEYCANHNITYQAYSPLCGGANGSHCSEVGGKSVLTVPEVQEIAAVHAVSVAQVALKWIVQQGHPLVTAVWRLDYMDEDLDLWSWGELSDAEMTTLSAVYGMSAATI